MPRRSLTSEEKVRNAERGLQQILDNYSISFIQQKRYEYRQNKEDNELKRFNALYRKVRRFKKLSKKTEDLQLLSRDHKYQTRVTIVSDNIIKIILPTTFTK